MKCPSCGAQSSGRLCEYCGTSLENVVAPTMAKPKKTIFKKWWFWVIIAVVVIGIYGASNSENGDSPSNGNGTGNPTSVVNKNKPEVIVLDLSKMDRAAIQSWADTNKVVCKFEEAYSDSVAAGLFASQSVNENEVIHEGDTVKIVFSLGKEPSAEFKNALKKAESYTKTMYMSKQGVYNQLTSEYGEKFPADAAQYAIDNLTVDWKENALKKAKTYRDTMNMSKSRIYDQLISEYGEKFTKEETQYAIDHLDD